MARFTLPRDLYHGPNALEALKTLPGKRAMICVGGGSMKRFGFLDRAEAYLNNGNYEASFEDVTTALKLDSKADVNDLVLQLLAAAPSAELVNRIASAYTLIK